MKTNFAKQNLVSFSVGIIFAVGLAIAGMTQPQNIIGFLNPWDWKPALIMVMIGAISIHSIGYLLIRGRKSPLLDTKWHIPTRKDLTARLIIGSALFGIGWGLAGFCPGPGLASIASGDFRPIAFVAAMLLGMVIFKKTEPHLKLRD